jgi:hypothetical protein
VDSTMRGQLHTLVARVDLTRRREESCRIPLMGLALGENSDLVGLIAKATDAVRVRSEEIVAL